ncbi:MAG: glycosyltransferase [Thermoplasmatales archaeon]
MFRGIRSIFKYYYRKARVTAREILGYPVLYNVNRVDEKDYNKRALLIYLVKPFLIKDDDPRFLLHQNLRQCKQIASVLGEFGYVVDVADVKDRTFKPSKRYDLVISHRVDIEPEIFGDALKIYLFTGINHIVHNQNVRRRFQMLYQRRRCLIPPYPIHTENMPYVKGADALVGFGNDFCRETWREVFEGPIYTFNNYGFQEIQFMFEDKDFNVARKNFLFFGSVDQVRKGLDLLLDIFPKHPELNLYICSRFEGEKEFCKCYASELWKTPNIHPIGWVTVLSQQFYELVRKCAYVILPTCSEGSVGSVVQCMWGGLIPIVTKEATIDTEDFGITLTNDSLEEIEKTVLELAGLPEKWHREHSIRTRRVAEEKYSEEAFISRWREIISDILTKWVR